MADFTDKIVVVTGGAGGLGKGFCLEFARLGAQVVCADLDSGAGNELLEESRSLAGRVYFVAGDLSQRGDCERVAAKAAELGGVDVLCNNVGIQPAASYVPIDELSEELWDRILGVNLRSFFLMTKLSIPLLRRRGGGVIINTASVQGLQSMKGAGAYAASKGGIIALTRQLAVEYAGEGIRVLAVAPGTFETPLVAEAIASAPDEGYRDRLVNAYPMKRLGRVEELARVVAFLAGDGASFMTGECITVDGGIMSQGGWA